MVEAIANSVEDRLIDGLSFKLAPGASYVTDRRSVTFHPQGSNIYKPVSGTKLIRFNLTGDAWLDPNTVRVSFTLQNPDSSKNLRTQGYPWGFFRRLRILAGGQIIEDIDNYNRVHHMYHLLQNPLLRYADAAENFGIIPDSWRETTPTTLDYHGIKPGQGQVVMFTLLSGLLNQDKYLPIRYMPLIIELELVDSMQDPILSDFYAGGTNALTTSNTNTTNWEIINCEVKADMCTLDNALDNSYAEHLLSGKSLPINYSTYVSQMQTVTEQKIAVNVARALTRLKSVMVSFQKEYDFTTTGSTRKYTFGKMWNDFFSPMSPENQHDVLLHQADGEFEFQLQIGSKLFPEYPIRSHAEAYYQLRKMFGLGSSNNSVFDITAGSYRDNKFVIGIDTEKVLEAGWTGLNTRAGDLMRVKFDLRVADAVRRPDRIHIVLQSDQILEIRDTGVQVFD